LLCPLHMAVVLVINDDRDLLETYQELIRQMGHVPVTEVAAQSGPETVRAAGAEALVVDLERPDESEFGLRVVEQVRADPELQALPIIVCTGAPEPHLAPVRGRLDELGVPVLPKPFTLEEFEAALDDLLLGSASGTD
jgi:CheY-like chemotaxis protein